MAGLKPRPTVGRPFKVGVPEGEGVKPFAFCFLGVYH
jgi:hypothetical protein